MTTRLEPLPNPSGPDLCRPFFTVGIGVVLSVGASWGLWILWQIASAQRFTGAPVQEVNAHGHAQVFGWVGLFVMGFAYQMFPAMWQRRLAGARLPPYVLAAMIVGIGVSTVATATPGNAWAISAALGGGALEIAAIATFLCQLRLTWRASLAPREPYLRFVATGLSFFLIQAVFSLWHTVNTLGAGDRQTLLWYVATYQAVLRDLQIHGFVLFLVLGVSMRFLPPLFGTAEVSARRARLAWVLLFAGVIGESALFLLYRFTGRHLFAAALLLPWLMLATGALSIAAVFRPWRPFPRFDRSAKFVRAAYLWLAASFVLLLLLPVYQAATHLPFSHAYYGSIRHAVTIGFASQMIMGMAARAVAELRRAPADSLPPLVGPFVLVNAGCFLRVTLQALTDVNPFFFRVVGVSGILELTALAWWAAHLLRLMWSGRRVEIAAATSAQ